MELNLVKAQMDPTDDAQWTADGSPRMEVIHDMSGDESITRKQVIDAFPDWNREQAQEAAAGGGEPIVPEITNAEEAKADDEQVVPETAPVVQPAVDEVTEEDLADVGSLPLAKIYASFELTQAYSKWLGKKCNETAKAVEAMTEELNGWAARSAATDRMLIRMERQKPKQVSDTKAYIKKQNDIRIAKAAAAQAFIDGGTNVHDVSKALGVKAPIDRALNARKATRGSTRPALGLPVRK